MQKDEWQGIEEAVAIRFTGSFTAAARHLNISTSQISRVIANLEDKLQTPIFVRTTRSLRITDAGKALIDQFEDLICKRRDILASAQGGGTIRGRLRVTCPLSFGESFVSPILQKFSKDFPGLEISLDCFNRVVDLINENYDLGVRTGDVDDERLIRTKLASRRISTAASPAFLDKFGTPASPVELSSWSCIASASPVWSFMAEGKLITLRPKGRWRTNSEASAAEAALNGLGIIQMPDDQIENALATGRLVRILDAYKPLEQIIWAVYPRQSHLEPKVRQLLDRLRQGLEK